MLSYLQENETTTFTALDKYFAKVIIKDQKEQNAELLLSTLMMSYRKGDVCLELSSKNLKRLFPFLSDSLVSNFLQMLQDARKLLPSSSHEKVNEIKYTDKPICEYEDCLYLQKNWVYENLIIERVIALTASFSGNRFSEEIFTSKLNSLNELETAQRQAVKACLDQDLVLVSGGPGTGKTFTAGKIIEVLSEAFTENRKLKVLLGAPTGKASFLLTSKMPDQILEKVALEAKTLHAILGVIPDRHIAVGSAKINADLVLIDEASMIDLRLMACLLSMIEDKTKLVLIGDKNQLSPIDTGQVFSDLCSLDKTVFLDKTHRFSNESLTQLNASICEGNINKAFEAIEKNDPCLQFIELESLDQLRGYLGFFPGGCNHKGFDIERLLEDFGKFRILSSLKQGLFGVDQINKWFIQSKVSEVDWGEEFAYPIMVTSNDYSKGLFNGMMGICITPLSKKVFPYGKDPKVYFPSAEGLKLFSLDQINQYELAYAMSVHKSQGSEFEEVVAILPDGSEQFGKELLYTAATRCKKKFTLITKKPIVSKMIETNGLKFSLLIKRLSRSFLS